MYKISEAISMINASEFVLRNDYPIEVLLTDSRSLSHASTTMFFALRTAKGDGHRYIETLYKRGVRAFVIGQPLTIYKDRFPEASFIEVKDVVAALQRLARKHREQFTYPVIGITGSNGKTVVKEFLYRLLRDDFHIVRSPRSYNSQIGVPISIWRMGREHDLGIFEAGISRPDEMSKIAKIIRPTIGVFTGIGTAHQENFKDYDEKFREKLHLFESAGRIIYNADDKRISDAMRAAGLDSRGLGWSRKDTDAELFIQDVTSTDEATVITFRFLGLIQSIVIPFIDEANIEDVLHCLAVLLILKPTALGDTHRFELLEPVEMRMQVKEGNRNNVIINDAYNNDLSALIQALDFLQRRATQGCSKRVLVLSDIHESGLAREALYHEVAGYLLRYGIDELLAVGSEICASRDCFDGIPTTFFPNTVALLTSNYLDKLTNACILIKGARAFRFEQVSDKMALRLHETTLEINLNALVDNLNFYRACLRPETRLVCMVKADGYGVGAYEPAKILEEVGVEYIAVAVADEGKLLRERGITLPIIVMNPETSAWNTITDYRLEPVIYSLNLLGNFLQHADRRGLAAYPIHIKIDSGMHRLGLMPEDVPPLTEHLRRTNSVELISVFSHLAAADDPALDAFTHRQIKSFTDMADRIEADLSYKPMRHILNTAGIERFSREAPADMARLGIGLYGISPNGNSKLTPVAKLVTTILQIKNISANEHIGYGCRGDSGSGMRIAILPLGYADGYRRILGGGHGKVLVLDTLCPTVGNICMDTCMIDISSVPEAREGDRVTIFGEPCLPLENVAAEMDTIPYELLTSLSPRVKRIYYRE